MNRLLRFLSSRTDLRTGKSASASGNLPLTVAGTFGGFPLRNYGVQGGIRTSRNTTPSDPVPPVFVGEATAPDGGRELSLTLSTVGAAGGGGTVTATFPGVGPLRALNAAADEIDFASKKLIRRVGVCRHPTVLPGIAGTYGTKYPSVTLQITDGTVEPSYSGIETTHWATAKRRDFIAGKEVGMSVQSGVFSVNLPRATYRKFVTGALGSTTSSDGELVPGVPAGEYRCDFFDGSSRVFTLPVGLDGIANGEVDLLTVSRSAATLVKKTVRREIAPTEGFTALPDHAGTGETVFRVAKASWGVKEYQGSGGTAAKFLSSHFTFVSTFAASADPTFFCDGEYLYFHVPGAVDLAGLGTFLSLAAQGGKPVAVVGPAAAPTVTVLSSYASDGGTAAAVTLLDDVSGGIASDAAFDAAADYTLVPAFLEFIDDESAAGRDVEIYYVLPAVDVAETEIDLPPLYACEGSTTFDAVTPVVGGLDPTKGSFSAYTEDQ